LRKEIAISISYNIGQGEAEDAPLSNAEVMTVLWGSMGAKRGTCPAVLGPSLRGDVGVRRKTSSCWIESLWLSTFFLSYLVSGASAPLLRISSTSHICLKSVGMLSRQN